jgi:hypothetical protein
MRVLICGQFPPNWRSRLRQNKANPKMTEQPKPEIGQIWRECDPRFASRYVRVFGVTGGTLMRVSIRAVFKKGTEWQPAPNSRETTAYADRFNGKRGGYEFVETAV